MKLYSVGAVAFYVSGWLFAVFSLVLILYTFKVLLKEKISVRAKIFSITISLSSLLIASYLLYWKVIGLRLWDY